MDHSDRNQSTCKIRLQWNGMKNLLFDWRIQIQIGQKECNLSPCDHSHLSCYLDRIPKVLIWVARTRWLGQLHTLKYLPICRAKAQNLHLHLLPLLLFQEVPWIWLVEVSSVTCQNFKICGISRSSFFFSFYQTPFLTPVHKLEPLSESLIYPRKPHFAKK